MIIKELILNSHPFLITPVVWYPILGLSLYILVSNLYLFVFACFSVFRRKSKPVAENKLRRIAVFIPAYKEDKVILDTVKKNLDQNYPTDKYTLVVVADSFEQNTLDELDKFPITTIEVSFELSTKAKALNTAMSTITGNYDIAVVLDADNIMSENFLHQVNEAFNQGYRAIQGHRCAKNMNTRFAVLDAISEEIGNSIFRKGHVNMGISSALIGSGAGFEYDMFKTHMARIKAIGGYDKALELSLLEDKIFIQYLDDALVYDEKVQKANDFYQQRRRWINTQQNFFLIGSKKMFYQLLAKGNIDYFDKVLQWAFPPRSILLLLTYFIGILVLIVPPFSNSTLVSIWLASMVMCFLSFTLSIPKAFYNKKTLSAVLSLPKAILTMLWAVVKSKGVDKKFIHTDHSFVEEDQKD